MTFSVLTNNILSTTIGSSLTDEGIGSGDISSVAPNIDVSSRENGHFFCLSFEWSQLPFRRCRRRVPLVFCVGRRRSTSSISTSSDANPTILIRR